MDDGTGTVIRAFNVTVRAGKRVHLATPTGWRFRQGQSSFTVPAGTVGVKSIPLEILPVIQRLFWPLLTTVISLLLAVLIALFPRRKEPSRTL